MFTGIVEETGTIMGANSGKLAVAAGLVLENTKLGDSMAVNGVCLTVSDLSVGSFSMDIMPETLRRTNLGRLRYGDSVNIERAMLANGRFGGHFVQGHVDCVGKVLSLAHEEESVVAMISLPRELMAYVARKGFIAVDGVSLTIIDYDDISFSVSLVAYTLEHTTLGAKRPGDIVNLEVDIIAKYVKRLRDNVGQGVTSEFLEEYGFLKVR